MCRDHSIRHAAKASVAHACEPASLHLCLHSTRHGLETGVAETLLVVSQALCTSSTVPALAQRTGVRVWGGGSKSRRDKVGGPFRISEESRRRLPGTVTALQGGGEGSRPCWSKLRGYEGGIHLCLIGPEEIGRGSFPQQKALYHAAPTTTHHPIPDLAGMFFLCPRIPPMASSPIALPDPGAAPASDCAPGGNFHLVTPPQTPLSAHPTG